MICLIYHSVIPVHTLQNLQSHYFSISIIIYVDIVNDIVKSMREALHDCLRFTTDISREERLFFDMAACFSLRHILENSLSSPFNNIFLPRALQINLNVLGSQKYHS